MWYDKCWNSVTDEISLLLMTFIGMYINLIQQYYKEFLGFMMHRVFCILYVKHPFK
jgi:hypothetical protein